MIKLSSILFFVLGITCFSFAQINKVNWEVNTTKIDNKTYEVQLTADVSDGWYIYSQFIDDGGPVPTDFEFTGDGFLVEGETGEESEQTKEGFDSTFNIHVKKFGGKVTFTQLVKKTDNEPTMTAHVTFMSCNDEMCLPPRQLKIPINFN